MTSVAAVRERGILFSGEMVRAILDGRKSQTRRVVKQWPASDERVGPKEHSLSPGTWIAYCSNDRSHPEFGKLRNDLPSLRCPYGQPGDRLWVREAFFDHGPFDSAHPELTTREERVEYREDEWDRGGGDAGGGWKPSIHMPRWASRLSLVVTEVRVERLQEISPDDAEAEGMEPSSLPTAMGRSVDVVDRYAKLWDSLNAKRNGGAYSWDRNPWVWALSYRVVS